MLSVIFIFGLILSFFIILTLILSDEDTTNSTIKQDEEENIQDCFFDFVSFYKKFINSCHNQVGLEEFCIGKALEQAKNLKAIIVPDQIETMFFNDINKPDIIIAKFIGYFFSNPKKVMVDCLKMKIENHEIKIIEILPINYISES